MAWPPNVTDNVDVVSAAHINSIVASIKTWQGEIDANLQNIKNLASITQDAWAVITPLAGWGQSGGAFPQLRWRKDKQGMIVLEGSISNGTATDGTVIGSMPVAGQASSKVIPIAGAYGATGATHPLLVISGAGSMTIYGVQGTVVLHIYGSYALI